MITVQNIVVSDSFGVLLVCEAYVGHSLKEAHGAMLLMMSCCV